MAVYKNLDLKTYTYVRRLLHAALRIGERYFLPVPQSSEPDILNACENPFSVSKMFVKAEYEALDELIAKHLKLRNKALLLDELTFKYLVFSMPQTQQMYLEKLLLLYPKMFAEPNMPIGMFCESVSYRQERVEDMINGRHLAAFNILDFEFNGGDNVELAYGKLIHLLTNIVVGLGFGEKIRHIKANDLNPNGPISSKDEASLCKDGDYSPVFITHFREIDEPFYNMEKHDDGVHFRKIDVLLPVMMPTGEIVMMEVIGSAVRTNDTQLMRERFDSIMNGAYRDKLYELFEKDRVEMELEEYMQMVRDNSAMIRVGGGIGLQRLEAAWLTQRALDKSKQSIL